eukprot:1744523-Rhodomonas_salina.1
MPGTDIAYGATAGTGAPLQMRRATAHLQIAPLRTRRVTCARAARSRDRDLLVLSSRTALCAGRRAGGRGRGCARAREGSPPPP